MRVRDIMTRDPKTCSAKTTLQDAAFLMREAGCGILPVLEQGRLIGVVTDRDICLDLAERDKPASEIEVSDAMSWRVYFCNQNDRISQALETMTIKQVRRLPVADDDGRLCGILSIDDVPSPALRF
ncbi:MAG TPA: CBS domain-containing protein, partial [Thermoanaerobaculia bacterium]|nr:CBS domain-containing protein [Thermoanaerobaculia bacterium]